MKPLVFILAFLSFSLSAFDRGGEIVSFYRLTSLKSPKESISLRGYLLLDGDTFYFCPSMESCYSRGKERIIVKSDGSVSEYLERVDECHMELSGKFQGLSEEQSSWPLIGYLYVDKKPSFDLSPKYKVINVNCEAFNVIHGESKNGQAPINRK